MNASLLISPAELFDLTGKQRPSAQGRALRILGIAFKERPGDGILLVSRAAAEAALGVTERLDVIAAEWEVDSEAIRNHGKKPASH